MITECEKATRNYFDGEKAKREILTSEKDYKVTVRGNSNMITTFMELLKENDELTYILKYDMGIDVDIVDVEKL